MNILASGGTHHLSDDEIVKSYLLNAEHRRCQFQIEHTVPRVLLTFLPTPLLYLAFSMLAIMLTYWCTVPWNSGIFKI